MPTIFGKYVLFSGGEKMKRERERLRLFLSQTNNLMILEILNNIKKHGLHVAIYDALNSFLLFYINSRFFLNLASFPTSPAMSTAALQACHMEGVKLKLDATKGMLSYSWTQ